MKLAYHREPLLKNSHSPLVVGEAEFYPSPVSESQKGAESHCSPKIDCPRWTEEQEIKSQHDCWHCVKAEIRQERQSKFLGEDQSRVNEAESPVQYTDDYLQGRRDNRDYVLGVE